MLPKSPLHMTRKQIYNDKRYKRAREICLQRAQGLCQECRRYGRTTPATTAHHKKSVEEFPELAFDPDNLAADCDACHNKHHPEKGGDRYRRR